MGLKGAASCFQRVMASIVLAGLIYITVDNLSVVSKHLNNLATPFERSSTIA
jgi:hypothetical protein